MIDATHTNFVCTTDDESRWHEERRKCVTGSVISALLGANPYMTREQALEEARLPRVWTDKRSMWWGREMEVPNLLSFGKLTGLGVRATNLFFRDGVIGATIDAVVDDPAVDLDVDRGLIGTSAPSYWRNEARTLMYHVNPMADKPILLEAKNTGERNVKAWACQAPENYCLQAQAQMLVTGLDCCVLVAKIGAADIRMHVVERDDGLMSRMVDAAEEFMKEVGE